MNLNKSVVFCKENHHNKEEPVQFEGFRITINL